MALRLRLKKSGEKKRPFYRLIAIDKEERRDGRALDYLGYYNPMVEPNEVKIDQERVRYWMNEGAKPTETVHSLLKKVGYYSQK